jgi:hypothetical protein
MAINHEQYEELMTEGCYSQKCVSHGLKHMPLDCIRNYEIPRNSTRYIFTEKSRTKNTVIGFKSRVGGGGVSVTQRFGKISEMVKGSCFTVFATLMKRLG